MPSEPASSCSASVSTLANVDVGLSSLDASKTGANERHGPHHDAQKSTRTMPSSLTVDSNWSVVRSDGAHLNAPVSFGLAWLVVVGPGRRGLRRG